LNPLPFFTKWRRDDRNAAKLYGSIVAQARLPIFYQGFGVPDTLEGRFLVLSLHLFAVLHRLKAEGLAGAELAQDLADRFSADMETVLREIGIGDMSIPKKVRGLAASSQALLEAYEEALAAGGPAVAAVITEALPPGQEPSRAVGGRLAHYLKETLGCLRAQDVAALSAGEVRFARAIPAQELGDVFDDDRG
jgi:cytochrome b pre-mRNA-processing protein 3